jgi:polysaccharide pyruvyl transferase CsaB
MKQVFIVGAYGQNNLGDEALLEVFIQQFGDIPLVVNSAQPELTARRYSVKTVGTYWNWPPRFSRLRMILQSDLIVFGGGSLLKEIEGRAFARVMYFVRILLILFFARLLGKQTAMLGVGMGPLNYPLYKVLTRLAARMTDLICVRDNESRDLLVSIGVQRPVHVTADAVFCLSVAPVPSDEVLPALDCPYAVVVPRYSLTESEQVALAQSCDHLIEKHQLRIVMMPFQTDYRQSFDDAASSERVRSLMQHKDAVEVWITQSPAAAFSVVGQAQLVLSARLHALIFAAMKSIPSIALSYEVKVASFMTELGQSAYSLSLRDLSDERVPGVLDRLLESRQEICEQVRSRAAVLRADSQRNFDLLRSQSSANSVLGSGAALFISLTIVNAGNYLFNLILGRWLGPKAFADLSLIVTFMLMMTFVTSTLSLITARFSATYHAQGNVAHLTGLRNWLGKWSMWMGIGVMLLMVLGAPLLANVFHTESSMPFIILGIGVPLFFIQSVDRGMLQGQTRFGRLAMSYQAEMWVRLVVAILLVLLGFAVNGAVVALSLSFAATWWVARQVRAGLPEKGEFPETERKALLRFVIPVVTALISQILINNSDILIVKHYFESEAAGHYAALALIGRIVFFATMSVVTMLFPIVAQKHQKGEPHRHLLGIGLGLVAAVSLVIIMITIAVPEWVVNALFGAAYLSMAPMLWLYAVSTAFYSLSNVIINYRLSTGRGGGSVIAISGSIAQVVGLFLFHSTLEQVVLVQIVAMGMMFVSLVLWDMRVAWVERHKQSVATYQTT